MQGRSYHYAAVSMDFESNFIMSSDMFFRKEYNFYEYKKRVCRKHADSKKLTDTQRSTNAKKKKNGSKGFAKPDAFLYYLAGLIVRPFLKFKLKTTYDLTAIKDISGPALVVCPHVSNIDFLLVAIALMPHRPTFVVSYHFMTHPKLRKLLERMHVIPKKMFCPDIKTIINIMRAKESGNIIVLFPEGRLTCFGHSLWVTEGTAELVKKLAVNVYTISEDGAYKTFPKWGISGFRPGKIHVRSSKLLDAAQIETMSVTEINNVLESAISP